MIDRPYFRDLKPASFRGVPFGVFGGDLRVGRRQAVHEYPNRETVWVEDMGRATRRITLTGFLLGDDVIRRREQLVAACETPGDGVLVHPSLGRLVVSLVDVSMRESRDEGRLVEASFVFVEAGARVFPAAVPATVQGVQVSALAMIQASIGAFVTQARVALSRGNAVAQRVVTTVDGFGQQVSSLARDATGLLGAVKNLPGSLEGAYGRYFGSGLQGFGNVRRPQPASQATVATLIAAGSASRTRVAESVTSLDAAAVGASADALALGNAIAAAVQALLASTVDPRDALRLMPLLSAYDEPLQEGTSAVPEAMRNAQSACLALFRRAALQALATAAATYQPQSADDAAAVRAAVCELIDGEITTAGDIGDDDAFAALRALRTAVALDLATRGAALPPIVQVRTPQPQPALVLAQRLYRDPTRADQLLVFGNPRHPLFMPTAFQALGS